jgi:hypothetical protein
MPKGLVLLRNAEHKLRKGKVRAALRLFRAIVDRYPMSLESFAAVSYLQDAR